MKLRFVPAMAALVMSSCQVSGDPLPRRAAVNDEPESFERIFVQDEEPTGGVRDNDIWVQETSWSFYRREGSRWAYLPSLSDEKHRYLATGLAMDGLPNTIARALLRTMAIDNVTCNVAQTSYETTPTYLQLLTYHSRHYHNRDRYLYETTLGLCAQVFASTRMMQTECHWRDERGNVYAYGSPVLEDQSPDDNFYYYKYLHRPYYFLYLAGSYADLFENIQPCEGGYRATADVQADYQWHHEVTLSLTDDGRYVSHFELQSKARYSSEPPDCVPISVILTGDFYDFSTTPRIELPNYIIENGVCLNDVCCAKDSASEANS